MNRRSLFKRLLGTVAAVTMASAVECFGAIEFPKKLRWIVTLQAAYKPTICTMGYMIRIKRFPKQETTPL